MASSGGKTLLYLLQSQGIEYIFCSPGSEWVPVWEELSRRFSKGDESLKYINCRHESLAVCAAIGYTKTTGRLPAILLHATVGPLHAAMEIRAAYIKQFPMIIFSAEDSDHGNEAVIPRPGAQWSSHLSDIGGPAALVRPYVKWSNTVRSKDYLVDSVFRGCHIAQTPPQGPVFIAISRELLFQSLPEIEVAPPSPITSIPEPASGDLKQAAKLLVESKRPIIITDYVGKNLEAVNKLIEIAELLGIPVFEGKQPMFCNFPRNHPMHMGSEVTEAIREADTVFVVGAEVPWYPPTAFPRKGAKAILLDETPLSERVPYWGYRIDLLLKGDIGLGLAALVDIIRTQINKTRRTGSRYQKRFDSWQFKHNQMVKKWKEESEAEKDNKPISPKWFLHLVNNLLPENSLIIEETVLHSQLIRRCLAEPNRYVRSVYGGLGVGFGEAVGTKLMVGNRPVLFFVGDGTFNYNPVTAGLGMCQEYNLPILIIVLNNGGYITMARDHHKYLPEGWVVSSKAYLGVDITPLPDYSKLAEAFGAYGEKIEEPKDIKPALNRALEQLAKGRAALLDVLVSTP